MSLPESGVVRDDDEGLDVADVARLGRAIVDNVAAVVDGKREQITTALTVVLSEGHLLVEDVPGVGKTVLAKAIARSIDCSISRIQFTPDLLPGDVTGVAVFDQADRRFVFEPGAVFANIVIGDEINRASPKTQSALLEAMEERQVTVDGTTYGLADPFVVVATQNPIEMEGTYALPEAQRDRFMARLAMGYPDADAELAMLQHRDASSPLDALGPVVDVPRFRAMTAAARGVFVSRPVQDYVVALVRATRDDPETRLGASPRATLQLVRAAKTRAALDGRDFVLPDDVDALAVAVLGHRLVLTSRALAGTADAAAAAARVVTRVVAATPVGIGGA